MRSCPTLGLSLNLHGQSSHHARSRHAFPEIDTIPIRIQLKRLRFGVGPHTGESTAVVGAGLVYRAFLKQEERAGTRLQCHHLFIDIPPLRWEMGRGCTEDSQPLLPCHHNLVRLRTAIAGPLT